MSAVLLVVQLYVVKGSGRYIPTTCESLVVYGRIREREKVTMTI